jgi:TetR/AcrR family transcriptional repressor of bet genes
MRTLKKKSAKPARIPRARNAHSRQRQRLIDACISALHIYGPSRTTVEKVVAIAKMSPGIVRFYFASKAAMLVASLQFLSAEFEEQLLVPVARLKSRPVAALELMVELYLDPEIASPRKVSVWYAFWGEASSRQEYYDICGQKDESFAALVRELIERLILDTSQPQLDPDGIALGLIGVLEMLWQDFAFRTEAEIDRRLAKRRAMAYLRSVFPGCFGPLHNAGGPASAERRLAGWTYADARQFAAERESVFQDSWQYGGHASQIPLPGDFIGVDLGVERALIVRGADGEVRAFRNSCSEAPHILTTAAAGHARQFECAIHGLQFDLDGSRRGTRGTADLSALSLREVDGLLLVRSMQRRRPDAGAHDAWSEFRAPPGLRPLPQTTRVPATRVPAAERPVAADWKLVVEHWLESAGLAQSQPAAAEGWSARWYERLVGSAADSERPRSFAAPNHLIEHRPDGITIFQVLPVAPGRSLVRRHDFTRCENDRAAGAARYLASRRSLLSGAAAMAVVESIQRGIVSLGHEAARGVKTTPALEEFRGRLIALMPAMAQPKAPSGG